MSINNQQTCDRHYLITDFFNRQGLLFENGSSSGYTWGAANQVFFSEMRQGNYQAMLGQSVTFNGRAMGAFSRVA